MAAELLREIFCAEEIEAVGECPVEFKQEYGHQKDGYCQEYPRKAVALILLNGGDNGQLVMAHQGGEAETGDGEER